MRRYTEGELMGTNINRVECRVKGKGGDGIPYTVLI